MRQRIRLGGAATTIIGALWGLIALIYATDSRTFAADFSVAVGVAAAGLLIVFATGEKS